MHFYWHTLFYQNASYAVAKCRFAAKPLKDQMTAQIGMRLTLRSFKRENRKISIVLAQSMFFLFATSVHG